MEPLQLVTAVLILASPSYQLRMDTLDDVLVYPLEAPTNIQKRAVSKKSDSFDDFIEDKLIQHSQALEQLVKMVQQNSDVTKQLVENMSSQFEKPKLPEKVEVQQPNRRFHSIDSGNSPFWRIGEKVPKYGNLIKNLAVKEYSHDSEPSVIVEQSYQPGQKLRFSRRSLDGREVPVPSIKPVTRSPWCRVALVCKRTIDPVCAFDDNFGYGRFDDICHMIQVNCFWKYNFSVVANCKPSL